MEVVLAVDGYNGIFLLFVFLFQSISRLLGKMFLSCFRSSMSSAGFYHMMVVVVAPLLYLCHFYIVGMKTLDFYYQMLES